MNPNLARLNPYPFERLRALLADTTPPAGLAPIVLSIGEPKHPTPGFIVDALREAVAEGIGRYPASRGEASLREVIAGWLAARFALPAGSVTAERHVLPVAGTREALFAVAQAVLDPSRQPVVAMPNPFYQIYEGAALLAGGEPLTLPTTRANGYAPDLDAVPEATWARCGLLYLCSPGNPSGTVLSRDYWRRALALADRYGFVIAADECYSELYADEANPPAGLLQVCAELGRTGFERCLVFHSLSKRSSAPGLRSGFVAGDAALIERFALYRTYHGCALPLHVQAASRTAWSDEAHVRENRRLYREKFSAVGAALDGVLDYDPPAGGFYLWARTPGADTDFARELYAREHLTVLPGRYLSRREPDGSDPGAGHVRIALVAERDTCVEAAARLRRFLQAGADRA
ncbi:succinyldiaminopimelate transaminase [Sediminicurvatus halobius]|uniref:Succinyldiaminopimelate transaminase n=1 Tax=Sediminicurvatus halobius TaxID=2182432 RepID=A0A2U2N490_9GAMM|nr:succinyldiaminopimelate transaminase [Spiribacter halobius]PWG63902.1 succinyldiaminopimelate transaminase [Spiribacter halobius]UEX76314.1 succinyldiaminopimelate transaminase [Spiribacter halobius]